MTGVAPLLFGAAAAGPPTAAGVAAAGSTAGLFGAAGSFGLFQTLSTLGTLFSAGSSIFAGQQEAQSFEFEAQQLELQSENERARAAQEEANRQALLTQILNNQLAGAAGRGIGVGSGSELAIEDFSIEEMKRESEIAASDSLFRRRQLAAQAAQARRGSRASMLSGYLGAGQTLFGSATRNFERRVTT